jgi:hypothetical protein
MPTVMRTGPYRLFFYSSDAREPRHVHVERDNNRAKFWLQPVRLANSGGFGPAEIREIQRVVELHRAALMRRWDAYFANP